MTPRVSALVLMALGLGAIIAALLTSPDAPPASKATNLSDRFNLLSTSPDRVRTVEDRQSVKSLDVVAPDERFVDSWLAHTRPTLWVFSSDHLLCLAQPRGAACAPAEAAAKNGLLLGTFSSPTKDQPKPHDFLLQGLVPDDVQQVLVELSNGDQLVVPVELNRFSVERDEPVRLKQLVRH